MLKTRRRAPHHQASVGRRPEGGQEPGGQGDAGRAAARQGGPQVQSDDELQPQPAGRTEPVGAGLHCVRPEPEMGERYHLYCDRRRLAGSHGGAGFVFSMSRGLGDGRTHDG